MRTHHERGENPVKAAAKRKRRALKTEMENRRKALMEAHALVTGQLYEYIGKPVTISKDKEGYITGLWVSREVLRLNDIVLFLGEETVPDNRAGIRILKIVIRDLIGYVFFQEHRVLEVHDFFRRLDPER